MRKVITFLNYYNMLDVTDPSIIFLSANPMMRDEHH